MVYLDVPQDVAAARGCYGGERYERREMQERVAREFEAMSSRVADWEVLDACRDIDAIHEVRGGGLALSFDRPWGVWRTYRSFNPALRISGHQGDRGEGCGGVSPGPSPPEAVGLPGARVMRCLSVVTPWHAIGRSLTVLLR